MKVFWDGESREIPDSFRVGNCIAYVVNIEVLDLVWSMTYKRVTVYYEIRRRKHNTSREMSKYEDMIEVIQRAMDAQIP